MEKDFRLFVKNLPLNYDENGVRDLVEKYVTVNKIDLKEKTDLDNKINKFAFINITTTDRDLHKCFGDLNGKKINGFQITVELAKESFLERLKRERNESQQKKDKPLVLPTEQPVFNHSIDKSKINNKYQKFDDVDFSLDDSKINGDLKINKKRKYEEEEKSVTTYENLENENYSQPGEAYSKDFDEPFEYKKREFSDFSNSQKIESKKRDKSKVVSGKAEPNKLKKQRQKIKLPEIDPNFKKQINDKTGKDYVSEQNEINESEKKRLMSLRQKKQMFKSQEQTIRNALKFVDNQNSNKKIVFDEDMDYNKQEDKNENVSMKKNTLFDSDDEDQEKFKWNEEELESKAKIKKSLLKLKTNIGNDKRFIMDERFLDDEDKGVTKESDVVNETEEDIVDEKKWQLDILGNVLGKSIVPPMAEDNDSIRKKNKMIRYDPTASNHQDYELAIEKSKQEQPTKKKKKKASVPEKEVEPLPISKDVFYDVSDKLVDSLKHNEGFSLLKTFGNEIPDPVQRRSDLNEEEGNDEGFKFNFSSKNPFKYDSSDDEDDGKTNEKESISNMKSVNKVISYSRDDRLFFSNDDPRFLEAENFFKNQSSQEEGTFKNRRRELKVIIRSKIRNNLKKTIPWNKKKVRKLHKKKK